MYFVLHSIALIYYNLLSSLHSIICQIVTNRRLNTRESFKLSAIKVVSSLTRDKGVYETTTATATGTPPNKRFNELNNGCARAF